GTGTRQWPRRSSSAPSRAQPTMRIRLAMNSPLRRLRGTGATRVPPSHVREGCPSGRGSAWGHVCDPLLRGGHAVLEPRSAALVKRTRVRNAIAVVLQPPQPRAGFSAGPPLAPWMAGDREVHLGWVGDGMTKYAHSSSGFVVALLALAAACGTG